MAKTIMKLQAKLEAITRDNLRFDADVLKLIEEGRTFALNSAKAMEDESGECVICGIEAEITIKERFARHLVGKDPKNPVL